jgi:hypothetical protein
MLPRLLAFAITQRMITSSFDVGILQIACDIYGFDAYCMPSQPRETNLTAKTLLIGLQNAVQRCCCGSIWIIPDQNQINADADRKDWPCQKLRISHFQRLEEPRKPRLFPWSQKSRLILSGGDLWHSSIGIGFMRYIGTILRSINWNHNHELNNRGNKWEWIELAFSKLCHFVYFYLKY